jgi:predicted acetyltransferase
VPAETTLQPLTAETRHVLERLWQLFRHDLSEFRGSRPDRGGLYNTRPLEPFLEVDRDRRAYLFEVDGGPVGFGLVGRVASGPKLMFEFFVVRAMRGQGVGRAAAEALFALHPGIWEIPFQEENPAAARFWRGVAAHAARDGVREERGRSPGSRRSRTTSGSPSQSADRDRSYNETPTPRSAARRTSSCPSARSHGAIPFDLKTTMSVSD